MGRGIKEMLQFLEINTYMSSTAVLSQNYMKSIQICQAPLYFPKIIGNCWVGRINATAIKDLHYNRNLKIHYTSLKAGEV